MKVPIVYITKVEQERLPLALVEPIVTDKGLVGARAAIEDNATTGRFLKHDYELIETLVPEDSDLVATFREQLAAGQRIFVADVHDHQLLAMATVPEAADALIFNVRSMDDRLRSTECHANLLHVMPSRAMKADALAQYLVWKKWRRWFLVHGTAEEDLAFAAALRRAATKFGAKIVAERAFEGDSPSARTDSGHAQIQMQMPVFTQEAPDHDVLMVADESDTFGEYLPYRTWDPRPVVGTQGLVPTAWHRSHEQWGGTQMQRRFEKFAGRDMTERDHTAWVAVRAIGEAVTRTNSAETATIRSYLFGDEFKLAAFKGEGLTFRTWNQQMRQPILLAAPRSLVSVSPQSGFLHQRTPLDSLGYDEPESECRLNGS
ncbi:MAG: ABC transporter substrate-binding protein [Kiloniellales bacterium]